MSEKVPLTYQVWHYHFFCRFAKHELRSDFFLFLLFYLSINADIAEKKQSGFLGEI